MSKKKILLSILVLVSLFSLVGCSLFGFDSKEPTVIEKENPTIVEIQNDITETYELVSKGCVGVYATSSSASSIGSGVIYKHDDTSGLYYVVTNAHVVDGMNKFKIYRGNNRYYKASLVGKDVKNDIAVLTFSLDLFGADDIYIVDIVNYDDEIVTVGQTALAIGCPLSFDNYNTLTTGVVSKVTKTQIQTNAEINPGNSGGGLFNASGRLIGINTEKEIYTTGEASDGSMTQIPVEGLGYAISLEVVKKCILDIEENGTIEARPQLGITVKAVNRYLSEESLVNLLPNTVDQAIVITEVAAGSASRAGLKANDVILKVNNETITNLVDLSYIVNLAMPNDTLTMEIYRHTTSEYLTINVTLN